MSKRIIKYFIKDYQQTYDSDVRTRYGILASIASIICNLVCALFKITLGLIAHSASVLSDGFNNISDVGSNAASLLGFALSRKHPDHEHPYGHGRYEYLMGLVVGVIIVIAGITSGIESIKHVIHPVKTTVSFVIIVALIITIYMKMWMYHFNDDIGDLIESKTLKAAAIDSKNDVIANIASIIGLTAGAFTTLPIDGLIGIAVSVLVIKGGVETISTMLDSLLGASPDDKLVKEIEDYVLAQSGILGLHDLMIHDYGPGARFLVMHIEVPHDLTLDDAHYLADRIERHILKKYNIATTIHVDPVNPQDPLTHQLKIVMEDILHGINKTYSLHDFRVVVSDHVRIICDILVTDEKNINDQDIQKQIEMKLKEYDPRIVCTLQFDHSSII